MLIKLLIVGAGGFVGAILRYSVGTGAHKILGTNFPYGTLTVNILGCLIIGLLMGTHITKEILSEELKLLFIVGMLGSFTTFSAFGLDTIQLFRNESHHLGIANILLHFIICLTATWFGFFLTTRKVVG